MHAPTDYDSLDFDARDDRDESVFSYLRALIAEAAGYEVRP